MKATQEPNFIRSATAPLMRATVMIANIIWKPENVRSGRPYVATTPPSALLATPLVMSRSPSRPGLKPIRPPLLVPNAMA